MNTTEQPAAKKKNITIACNVCRTLRRKCSGSNPCEYCQAKGRICSYAEQTKRGPKKKKVDSGTVVVPGSSLEVAEYQLYSENERNHAVDSYFNMRCWWKHLLDIEALKNPTTPAGQVVVTTITAFMARFMKQSNRAQQLFNTAHEMAQNVFVGPSAEATCTYMMMAEFVPASFPQYFSLAWNNAKFLPEDKRRSDRVRSYSYMAYLICGKPPIEKQQVSSLIAEHASELMAKNSADLWDVCFILALRIYKMLNDNFGDLYSTELLFKLRETRLNKKDFESALADTNMFDWILRANTLVFGDEYLFLVQIVKAILHWRGGELSAAVTECNKVLESLRLFGNKIIFLVDSLMFAVPALILFEAGLIDSAHEILNFLHQICLYTNQLALYHAILSLVPTLCPPESHPVQVLSNITSLLPSSSPYSPHFTHSPASFSPPSPLSTQASPVQFSHSASLHSPELSLFNTTTSSDDFQLPSTLPNFSLASPSFSFLSPNTTTQEIDLFFQNDPFVP